MSGSRYVVGTAAPTLFIPESAGHVLLSDGSSVDAPSRRQKSSQGKSDNAA